MGLRLEPFEKVTKSVKYFLKNGDADYGYGYIFDREINPIEIYIYEQYQSNGYGKFLFHALEDEAKKIGMKGMVFELNEKQTRAINIVSQAGAVQVGKKGETIKFILKL